METRQLTKILKALANEQRLSLFMMIAENCCNSGDGFEKTFTHACRCMDLSRSTISHHMSELQRAGLITCERTGQSYRCRVNSKALEPLKKLLG